MQIKCFNRNEMGENCWFLKNEETEKAVVIDPGFPLFLSEEEEKEITAVLLTHGHFDHMGFADSLRKKTGVPIYIHCEDGPFLTDGALSLKYFGAMSIPDFEADHLVNDGDEFEAGGMHFTVLHTPGHTKGSCCYLCEDLLFTGDTLMCGSVGRMDFPTGNEHEMLVSLKKLAALPNETKVYPGHGPETTIAEEKQSNFYMRGY